jgi:hypothetical protein
MAGLDPAIYRGTVLVQMAGSSPARTIGAEPATQPSVISNGTWYKQASKQNSPQRS